MGHGPDYACVYTCSQNSSRHAYKSIFVAFSSCFTACPMDKTASTASIYSDNADRVDPRRLPSGSVGQFWVTCMHTEVLR